MQFVLGSPKAVLMAPSKDERWRDAGSYAVIKHPIAMVVGCFFLALLFAWLIATTGFEFDAERLLKPDAMVAYLLLLLLIALPHELLHAVTFPDRGRSALSSIGCWARAAKLDQAKFTGWPRW